MRLSSLEPHPMERSDLEQYATEGNLAAEWLAAMAAFGDLDGRAVVDVGAGNGILGLGALMLGATSVRLVEADPSVAEVAKADAFRIFDKVLLAFEEARSEPPNDEDEAKETGGRGR